MNDREEFTISRESPLPLYYQIRQQIEQDLIAGRFPHDTKLPSENELAEMFNVSRMTVRRAIDQLVSKGFLTRIQGRGTFVNKVPDTKTKSHGLTRWSFELIPDSGELRQVVQQVNRVSPSLRVANMMHTLPGELVIQISRILYRNEAPFGYALNYIPEMLVPNIEEFELEDQTIQQFLTQQCGLEFGKAVERVLAIGADEDTAEILEVEPGSPLLYIDSLIFLRMGIPAILSGVTYRPEYVYRGRLRPLVEDKDGRQISDR